MTCLLRAYIDRARLEAPSPGINPPAALRQALAINDFEICEETVTDGNCGVHGFGLSLHMEGQRNLALRSSAQYKALAKVIKTPKEMIKHLREKAYSWMVGHADDVMWEGHVHGGVVKLSGCE